MTTTEPVDPSVFNGDEKLKRLLTDEAVAHRKYREYQRKADEWEKYRNGIRRQITAVTGSAPIVKVDGEVVLTFNPKDQFSGTRFAEEYPALAEEYTRERTTMELDVEALRSAHPEIASKFTVRVFTNKVDG